MRVEFKEILGHELEFFWKRTEEEIWRRENGRIVIGEMRAKGSNCREEID